MESIHDILKAAGDGRSIEGAARLARATEGSLKPVSADAVWRWPRTGIPDVHWPVVMRLVPSLSADDLLQLNVVARKSWAEKRAKSAA